MSTKTMPGLDAFAKKAKPKSSSTKEKLEVVIPEAKEEGFSQALKDLERWKDTAAEAKTGIGVNEDIIKPVVVRTFLDLYNEKGARPDSFIVKGERGGKIMVVPVARFATLPDDDEDGGNPTVEQLRADYGENMVSETTEYSLNMDVIGKYAGQLMEFLDSLDIPEGDAPLVAKKKYTVNSDALEMMAKYTPEKRQALLTTINPVIQLKNVR